MKQHDDRQEVVILLVADTRYNRRVLRLAEPDLAAAFPTPGRAVLEALSKREAPRASGILLL